MFFHLTFPHLPLWTKLTEFAARQELRAAFCASDVACWTCVRLFKNDTRPFREARFYVKCQLGHVSSVSTRFPALPRMTHVSNAPTCLVNHPQTNQTHMLFSQLVNSPLVPVQIRVNSGGRVISKEVICTKTFELQTCMTLTFHVCHIPATHKISVFPRNDLLRPVGRESEWPSGDQTLLLANTTDSFFFIIIIL